MAAIASSSQREGNGVPFRVSSPRQAYRPRVSSISHHGARCAWGAITMSIEAASQATSRAVTKRASGASGCGTLIGSARRGRIEGECLQAGATVRITAVRCDLCTRQTQAVAQARAFGGEHPAGES